MTEDHPYQKAPEFTVETFPDGRQFTIDIGQLGLRKHHVRALIELDVTEARARLREAKQSAPHGPSFTAWLLKCLATTLVEHPRVNAMGQGRHRRVLFRDVDISIMVERELDGQPVPLPLVLRAVNEKSIAAIHAEIQAARRQTLAKSGEHVLGRAGSALLTRCALLLPRWLRLIAWRGLLANPHRAKKLMGNVMFSSVGAGGLMRGWAVPVSIHPLALTVAPICRKPGILRDRVEIREYLPVTVLIDHDVVDGMPMARFIARFTELVEACDGLPERETSLHEQRDGR